MQMSDSTSSAIKWGCEVVKEDKYVSQGALSLNGHGSLYSISAKVMVFTVPILGQKSTNMQSTEFNTLLANKTALVFLFGDSMPCHSNVTLFLHLKFHHH